MSDKEKREDVKNQGKTGEHTPHSSKKVHSEYDNSTKDGLKINGSNKKSEK